MNNRIISTLILPVIVFLVDFLITVYLLNEEFKVLTSAFSAALFAVIWFFVYPLILKFNKENK